MSLFSDVHGHISEGEEGKDREGTQLLNFRVECTADSSRGITANGPRYLALFLVFIVYLWYMLQQKCGNR